MTDTEARALLEQALSLTGMSLRAFAEVLMVRDERTVRRWRAGDTEIPDVAVTRLRAIIREHSTGR
jgi:DNA-binding transcriptional regulator YiaG